MLLFFIFIYLFLLSFWLGLRPIWTHPNPWGPAQQHNGNQGKPWFRPIFIGQLLHHAHEARRLAWLPRTRDSAPTRVVFSSPGSFFFIFFFPCKPLYWPGQPYLLPSHACLCGLLAPATVSSLKRRLRRFFLHPRTHQTPSSHWFVPLLHHAHCCVFLFSFFPAAPHEQGHDCSFNKQRHCSTAMQTASCHQLQSTISCYLDTPGMHQVTPCTVNGSNPLPTLHSTPKPMSFHLLAPNSFCVAPVSTVGAQQSMTRLPATSSLP